MTRALVLGSAECVWRDADAALELFRPDAIYACNDIGARWPGPLDVWCTLHPEHFARWLAQRARRGHAPAAQIVSHLELTKEKHRFNVDRLAPYRWPESEGQSASGSSGLFAAKLAQDDGHDRIVLAGIPMTREAGNIARAGAWHEREHFVRGWELALPRIRARVRSMSGWTQQLLGSPTPEWLAA